MPNEIKTVSEVVDRFRNNLVEFHIGTISQGELEDSVKHSISHLLANLEKELRMEGFEYITTSSIKKAFEECRK